MEVNVESFAEMNHCFECGVFCPLKAVERDPIAHPEEESYKCVDCDKTFCGSIA